MENQIQGGHVIIIAEWDFERKVEIVVTGSQVLIYVNGQLVATKPAIEFYKLLGRWASAE